MSEKKRKKKNRKKRKKKRKRKKKKKKKNLLDTLEPGVIGELESLLGSLNDPVGLGRNGTEKFLVLRS